MLAAFVKMIIHYRQTYGTLEQLQLHGTNCYEQEELDIVLVIKSHSPLPMTLGVIMHLPFFFDCMD